MIAVWDLQNHPLGYPRQLTRLSLRSGFFFDFATAKSGVFQGGGLKILFLINFLHLASVAAALQSFR